MPRISPTRALARRAVILLGALALGLALSAVVGSVAFAHAYLVRSVPAANAVLEAPPGELRLWFAEPPELRFSQVELLDRAGQPVKGVGPLRGDPSDPILLVVPLEALPPGVYTAAWRVLSTVDGHVTAGRFAFAVGRDQVLAGGPRPPVAGDTDSGPTLPAVAVRWLWYLGMALLLGGFAFYPLVLGPSMESLAGAPPAPGRSGPGRTGGQVEPEPPPLPPTLLLLPAAGWGGATLATLVGTVVQASTSAAPGEDPISSLAALLFGTRYGTLFWNRVLILALVGVLLAFLRRQWRRDEAVPAWWWWAGVELGALALLTASTGSHAASGPSPMLSIGVHWIHMMAATFWGGGMAMLLATLPWVRGREGAKFPAALAHLVGRFSALAALAVAILGATGLYRAVVEVSDWQNLLDTPYGMALLVKLGLILPLLGLAAANLLVIKRRLAAAAGGAALAARALPWYRRLRGTVGGEVLFLSAVLLVTGLVTSLPPARDVFGRGLVVRGQGEDLRAVLAVNPGRAGFNSFDLYLRDGALRPVAGAEKVALLFTRAGQAEGETEAVAEGLGNGRYALQGGYLSTAGDWRVELLVRRSGRDDVRIPFLLQPRNSPGFPR